MQISSNRTIVTDVYCNRKYCKKVKNVTSVFFYIYIFSSSAEVLPDDPCILDLGFILDASGSITFAWPGVREFVANVIKHVNVSTDGSHIGIIKFGADSNVEFGFSEGQDRDTVIRRVLSLSGPKPFANTQLHLGIKDADEKLYNEATSSYRIDPSVRKVSADYMCHSIKNL